MVLIVVNDWFRVEVGYTLDFEERVVDWMCEVIAHPLRKHNCDHYWKQKRHVVRDFDLEHSLQHGNKLSLFVLKCDSLQLTMITVSDIVSLETPPKNEAAPTSAIAPGSIHFQKLSVGTPP